MTREERNNFYKERALSIRVETKEGYTTSIIEYFNAFNCTVKFAYNGLKVYNVQYDQFKSGQIKNPYHKGNEGVGYIGEGIYDGTKFKKAYNAWSNMLTRGYNKEYKESNPTYKDVVVCDKWHCFQNFAEWFENNYVKGCHLDKDILSHESSKTYSPETCCFVPREINAIMVKRDKMRGELPIGVSFHKTHKIFQVNINKHKKTKYIGSFKTKEEAFQAYKTAKELWIKEVADKWREQITEQVYQALINYKVEITD